ncbi:hypothetical protein [Tuwongella immobilis]|uniref:Uncharacterized protein n=1 Tax=Tuwongella immobilis TaxID=692036 RepID=A0A6C2YMW7_9BACT|nr:hypothetical protein [Tuwongella immobilis]VIP02724.1 unnamed protein product [Tuwongella immobilis]VTS02263.1 unnamed protein product [Tuwongella immobilis]
MATDLKPTPDLVPPSESFWQQYNHNREFPIGVLLGCVVYALVALVIVLTMRYLMIGPSTKPVPIKPVIYIAGDENEDGDGGRPGEEGGPVGERVPMNQPQTLTPPTTPELMAPKENQSNLSPTIDAQELSASDEGMRAAAFDKMAALDETIRNKITGGAKKDTGGNGNGASALPGVGDGEGGFGGTKTSRRIIRWKLVFNTRSGTDYLAQLAALEASIAVPEAPSWDRLRMYPNPNDSKRYEAADPTTFPEMHFIDDRRSSVSEVAEALNLNETPPYFLAFIPKKMEEELARLERGFRNRKEEEIASTTFQVLVVNGKPQIRVTDQQLKR